MTKFVAVAAVSAIALAACTPAKVAPSAAPEAPAATEATAPAAAPVNYGKAATYTLDKGHASLTWRVKHVGLSYYTARFTDFDATLNFNPADPAATSLEATINPASVETDYPGDYKATHTESKFNSWDQDLSENANWFNSKAFPAITFKTTSVTKETDTTGKVTGDLTFLGVTKPVTLDVIYNGVAQMPWAPDTDKIGFSANTVLKRSDFGMKQGIPMLGDDVQIIIEAEFEEKKG
jgi:polyisoprenoid-binding protein YceI